MVRAFTQEAVILGDQRMHERLDGSAPMLGQCLGCGPAHGEIIILECVDQRLHRRWRLHSSQSMAGVQTVLFVDNGVVQSLHVLLYVVPLSRRGHGKRILLDAGSGNEVRTLYTLIVQQIALAGTLSLSFFAQIGQALMLPTLVPCAALRPGE